jgi:hypothetical protein
MDKRLRILSLGAGVQSTTLALMCAHGEIDPVGHAIFADTGAEPLGVYRHLDWLEQEIARCPHPFPVHRVSAGNLRDAVLESAKTKKRVSQPPFFTSSPNGSEGVLRRKCTHDYKLVPIERKVKDLMGIKPRQRQPKKWLVEQLIGISWDEATRMKPARLKFVVNRYPLVDLHMTRGHCLEWMAAKGYALPPKSACTFCPYHDDAMWRDLQLNDPESFADAVKVDEAIRAGISGTSQQIYLHRSLKPISEIDFTTAEEAGQGRLFGNECEGMCGV